MREDNISKTRLRSGQEIWNALNESLRDDAWKVNPTLFEAYHLFGQATKSFDVGLYEATALLCRATLESAFFLYLTREWDNEEIVTFAIPTTLDGRIRSVEFEELARAIKKKLRLSESQSLAIARIQNDGNFVAHFASRREKELEKYTKKVERVARQIGADPNRGERPDVFEKMAEMFPFGIRAEQAFENLRDTSSIFLTLFMSMTKPQSASHQTKTTARSVKTG